MFSDKTYHNIQMLKVITRHLELIEELCKLVENNVGSSKVDGRKWDNICTKYQKMMKERRMELKKIVYITREKRFHYLHGKYRLFAGRHKEPHKKEGELKTKKALRKMGL